MPEVVAVAGRVTGRVSGRVHEVVAVMGIVAEGHQDTGSTQCPDCKSCSAAVPPAVSVRSCEPRSPTEG